MDRREASQLEEARLSRLVNAITDYAIYMLDEDGHIASWNPGAQRFKLYEEWEIVGQHFSKFYTEEDRRDGLPRAALETAVRDGRYEGEGWRLRKDGSRFWAHVVIDPIRGRDDPGHVIGYAKVTRDLTEQLAARQALWKSENQFSLLVQNVTDYAIYLLDLDGRISSWNAGAERIKLYAPPEIIGQHFSVFYTQEERAKGEPMRALHVAAREGRFATEGWRVRKDGSVFWASVVIDVILANREIVGFAKVTRDLTETKKSQLELERARDALLRAQKIAAAGQLSAGVAQDFNAILGHVLSSLEALQAHLPDDPAVSPLLDGALQAARRGTSLTQRMTTFAQRQELRPEATDVKALIAGMMPILARSVGPSITIETSFPESLGAIRVDPGQFEIAILNLAQNAGDAMADGGRMVIAAQEESVVSDGTTGDLAAGRYVRFCISDDGEGMETGVLSRAREALFSTKYPDQGSGLGLTVVTAFAEQSGGRFILRSKRGKGTVAELWLPMAPVEATDDAGSSSRQQQAMRALAVLAVDDDRLSLMQTSTMLNGLGHKVFTATSGEAALAMLRRRDGFDVVLIDHSMPGMTGAELVELIRMERPMVAVILATPLADATLLQIPKPLRQEDLAAALAQAVSRPATVRLNS